jgi:predicted transcriptional regulator
MTELVFDPPVPEMLEDADAAALAAIDQGLAQVDAGQGIPLSELRAEFTRRCAR